MFLHIEPYGNDYERNELFLAAFKACLVLKLTNFACQKNLRTHHPEGGFGYRVGVRRRLSFDDEIDVLEFWPIQNCQVNRIGRMSVVVRRQHQRFTADDHAHSIWGPYQNARDTAAIPGH